ncbi:MAG: DUF108 domain-containing protein [Lachnospiraceae bacterium]|nr:DUF108 domain-containing protein [Lachnospiraceae bacterium]
MKKIAFLGGGKIGRTMVAHVTENKSADVAFIYDPFIKDTNICGVQVVSNLDTSMFEGLDLVVECATAEVLQKYAKAALAFCSIMPFSMTAFRDDAWRECVEKAAAAHGTSIYLPHGAILGLDGISDGQSVLTEVSIETIKNPKSLGREDTVRTVVYEGPTREAAGLYPRNVNVHAAVALAGLGFDKTHSKIISDPDVNTNTHLIHLVGQGIDFTLRVSSFSEGGVSGKYVPLSACGSLDRVLGGFGFRFV